MWSPPIIDEGYVWVVRGLVAHSAEASVVVVEKEEILGGGGGGMVYREKERQSQRQRGQLSFRGTA